MGKYRNGNSYLGGFGSNSYNPQSTNQDTAGALLEQMADYDGKRNREDIANLASYYQHLADQEYNSAQVDLQYDRSKAENQVRLMMDAGMTRQAALAALQGGSSQSAAASPQANPISNEAGVTPEQIMQGIQTAMEFGKGLIGGISAIGMMPAQFAAASTSKLIAEKTSQAIELGDAASQAFNTWRQAYPTEYPMGQQFSLDQARQMASQVNEDGTPVRPGLQQLMASPAMTNAMNGGIISNDYLNRMWEQQFATKGYHPTETESAAVAKGVKFENLNKEFIAMQSETDALIAQVDKLVFMAESNFGIQTNAGTPASAAIYSLNNPDLVTTWYSFKPNNDDPDASGINKIIEAFTGEEGNFDPRYMGNFIRMQLNKFKNDFATAQLLGDDEYLKTVLDTVKNDAATNLAFSILHSVIAKQQQNLVTSDGESPTTFGKYAAFTQFMSNVEGWKPIEIGLDTVQTIFEGISSVISGFLKKGMKDKPTAGQTETVSGSPEASPNPTVSRPYRQPKKKTVYEYGD